VTQGTSFEGFSFGLHQGDSHCSQLIAAARRGDAAAFQELVHCYDAVVMRVALALTGSEDSAQEIYFRAFRDAFASVTKLDFDTSVFVWLHRILVKHCIDYCRRNQGYFARSGSESLAELLRTLPPTERVVFLLKHSQGLKIRTVAEIFRCSPEHITSVLQHATIRLRARSKPSFHQVT
jgi:RNA polymerase sigma-70 factor (ECF subfamily)